ncbi:putative 20S cyclosome subunit [Talaromyces proteolyticus]|uniref:20S cyclosome subunit n=1 Tax=Talaromyces proteolyticus TaxID=1131652 RepID=A0AAD4PSF0_9EURO|nr:putative 20S cyclosome subunit [Talaromyces proteolyticus]KAH8688755.1 putative 20S cyclosome subunit [Talaromyces proteolyticus]
MASVRSVGLHEPPALPFLVSEGLVPLEPTENDYVWKPQQPGSDDDITYTKNCAVWSRGGVVKRVFKLDIENEEIRHVVLTSFPSVCLQNTEHEPRISPEHLRNGQTAIKNHENVKSNGSDRDMVVDPTDHKIVKGHFHACSDPSKALVVVLKTQAHIFFLAGNSHVVPLPFEVDSVFASPRGLIFQRRLPVQTSQHGLAAPPNSFISQQTFPEFQPSQSFRLSTGKEPRLSTTLGSTNPSKPQKRYSESDMPRTFSLTDPHSEMGLVVSNLSNRATYAKQEPSGFDTLDPADEIIYVSSTNELPGDQSTVEVRSLILVVTINTKTGLYTIWTARYRLEATGQESRKRRKPVLSGARSKRRSSHFGMTSGTATPAVRPSGMRESLGTARNVSGPSFSQGFPAEEASDQTDFASQIGQDFADIGGPSKTSRRVSSLVARAELGTSQDRTTFTDLATGNPGNTANYGSLRQSMGAYSSRASFGHNLRSSFAGNASVYSNTSSFMDAPVDRLLEELNNGGGFEGFESMDLTESMSELPKEMILQKVESFSSAISGSSFSFSEPRNSQRPRVFTLRPDEATCVRTHGPTNIGLCLLDRRSQSLVVVNLKVERANMSGINNSLHGKSMKTQKQNQKAFMVQATSIRHGPNVVDACKVVDGGISRILVLTSTMDGKGELTLQSPWSPPVKIELPAKLLLHPPHRLSFLQRTHEAGLRRTLENQTLQLVEVRHSSSRGKIDVVDSEKRCHHIEVQLQPKNALVKRILDVCRFVLRDSLRAADGLYTAWWEVLRWLQSRKSDENDLEWTAIVVVLFSMAVGFMDSPSSRITVSGKQRRRKGLLRSSSGSHIDQESWETMVEGMAGSTGVTSSWMMSCSWAWVSNGGHEDGSKPFHVEKQPFQKETDKSKNTYIIRCASLARDFFESPQGEAASGSDGYLPTALCQDLNTRRKALCSILVGLHLLREEQKLSIYESESSYHEKGMLAPVLAQIGRWVGWTSWTWKEDGYYGTELATMSCWAFEDNQMLRLDVPAEPFAPPSIFGHLQSSQSQNVTSPFFTLLDVVSATDRRPRKGSMWDDVFQLTPRTLAINGFMSEVGLKSTTVDKIQLLLRWGLTSNVIETLPEGVSVPLFETIAGCQIDPPTLDSPTSWTSALVELIDRDDLYMSMEIENVSQPASRMQLAASHDSVRDIHHIGISTLEFELSNSFEVSVEADRIAVTRLIFREDRRFLEASKLLNQSKAPIAQCIPEPDWSDSDLLEAQKEVVQLVTLRTLSVPAGRSMFMFSGRSPLLTEKLPIPSFSLQCIMKSTNVTISADRSAFSEEKVAWAFFHNGAATGLAISRASRGIDTSWILYNKPQELTNRHAGFLLALGLNGHLKNLAKWVAFKYLTPKHTMTSIGLLLGMSASYLGTMDILITRLLSVHVTRLLPQGAAELNLSPLTQTAGVMGIGLLYFNSQHRRMSEILLSEIENIGQEESSISQEELRDEGYRLAAGFALGLINLGKGKDLKGLRDMQVVERLLTLAVGTKDVDLVHILDRATAGATVALAIIFMKTNDETLARKIDIPNTTVQFDYIRPDLFLLRTMARHIIMWDSIEPSPQWLLGSLPNTYRKRYRLTGIRNLSSDDMPFFNIIAGLCFAIGLRYAGSANPRAKDLLLSYLDQFIRIVRLPAPHYDGRLARNSVRHCQDIVAISAAAVMAGTGDLALFRRLRSLHGRIDPDTSYGSHMAAHMAIGLLFLGGGSYTLGTSNLAIASLMCAFYPIFPMSVLDNKCHLQAFRHLWVLAAEPRCLVARDVDTRRPMTAPISIITKDGQITETISPCLLPDLDDLVMVRVHCRDHWPLVLDFEKNKRLRDKFRRGDQSIYLRRNTTYDASGGSIFATTLSGLSEAQDILPNSLTGLAKGLTHLPNPVALLLSGQRNKAPQHDLWDWVFALPSLQGLDLSERSAVLPPSAFQFRPHYSFHGAKTRPPWLRLSPVDSRLVLESTVNEAVQGASGHGTNSDEVKDRLWQLCLLFDWIDREVKRERQNDAEGTLDSIQGSTKTHRRTGLWLRWDVIEEARWKIWGVQVGDKLWQDGAGASISS